MIILMMFVCEIVKFSSQNRFSYSNFKFLKSKTCLIITMWRCDVKATLFDLELNYNQLKAGSLKSLILIFVCLRTSSLTFFSVC